MLSEENKSLGENVTTLSAQNETLHYSISKAESSKELAEKKLSEVKSDLATVKTMFNPRNVKRREETKQRQISQLETRLDKKSEEVKEFKREFTHERN